VKCKFVVEDRNELLSLHRALLEAKFSNDPNDPAVIGSKIIADLSNRVVDSLIRSESETGEKWEKWRKNSISVNRREWKIALNSIPHKKWAEWDKERKINFIEILFSPFQLTEELQLLFIKECDKEK
jgi:hypothetical protein